MDLIITKIEELWDYLVNHHKWVYAGIVLTIIVTIVIKKLVMK